MWCQISINFWRMIIYFFTTSTCIIILQANPSSQIYNPWDYRREDVPNVEISWGQCLESRHRRELFDCGGSNFSPERGTGRRTRWKLSSHMTLSLATIHCRWPRCNSHQFSPSSIEDSKLWFVMMATIQTRLFDLGGVGGN